MLDVRSLSVSYGGAVALSEVSIAVNTGEVVGLIGANGAGKTTFIDGVTGFAASTGSVQLSGRDLAGLAPHRRARLGLGRTWQGGELFEDITVRDNLRIGLERARLSTVLADVLWPDRRATPPVVEETLELLGLTDEAESLPADLSQGKRKLVGVGRALASGPQILLLDEPAAGLTTAEGRLLGDTLKTLAHDGRGLLLIEHDVSLVLAICTRVYVLERGSLLAEGTASEIRQNERVIEAYLGRPRHETDEVTP
jgi:branched-chain amino acid transport system ATP-binding protein